MRSLVFTLLLVSASILHGESRTWKNTDGSQSFTGEYVTHDSKRVIIRRADGRVFTLELSKLHETDTNWLSTKRVAGKAAAEPLPDPNAVFDTLCFGDSRADVTKKLKESKIVEAGLDETFLGRVGLNGTYRTRKQIGGLHCELYFDWSAGGNLSEVSLQTQGVDRSAYAGRLKANLEELAELLTMLHGKPLQDAGFPSVDDLQDDLFLASHLWRLEGGGSALLGTSMQGGKYLVVVRFTQERINPVTVP
jgi:hypothetical protein